MHRRESPPIETANHCNQLEHAGYTIVRQALDSRQLQWLEQIIASGLTTDALNSRGVVVAARGLLDSCPEVIDGWKSPPLVELLTTVLGPECGLVRVLFFDKPPERTWALPWHRDRTIALREHPANLTPFSKPTIKEGVPHVEATPEILQQMLTLRIHLDDADADNGALRVIAGSHANESEGTGSFISIDVTRGDCLAMRPLLSHSSRSSTAGSARHRRVLHLEFAGMAELPGDCEWHDFHRVV